MTDVGSGWGSESWGSGPWGGFSPLGGGAPVSTFSLIGALAVSENVVRLTFNVAVSLTGLLDVFDGTDVSHYSVVPVAGTVGLDGSAARAVSVVTVAQGPLAQQVDLTLDRPLTPYPSQYIASATGLYDIDDNPQSSAFVAQLAGLYRGINPPLSELVVPSRDFSNPQTLDALLDPLPNTTNANQLGTFPIDETGDVAFDEGLTSYKKRVFRRLTTRKGAYLFLPDYGVTSMLYIKRLARPGLIQFLANEAEEQIKQEPETQKCSVVIVQSGALTFYQINIRTSAGRALAFNSPIQVQGA